MACITVKTETGDNDSRFLDLVNLFGGDEQKALKEFVRSHILGERSLDFMVIDSIPRDAKEFIDQGFSYSDQFTEKEANNIRAIKNQLVTRVDMKGVAMFQMFDATGQVKVFPEKDLDKEIESYIRDKQSINDKLTSNVSEVVSFKEFPVFFKLKELVVKKFPRLDVNMLYQFLEGVTRSGIKAYADYQGSGFHLPSLNDPNILLAESTGKGGKKFDILFTTLKDPISSRLDKGGNSFMMEAFKSSNHLAEKAGLTLKDNFEGRKTLEAALIALAIKANDPTAKIGAVRLGNFFGHGKSYKLNLFAGISNLRALHRNPETRKFLPADIVELIEKTKGVPDGDFLPDFTEALYAFESGKKAQQKKGYSKELIAALEGNDREYLKQVIDERIFNLDRLFGNVDQDGKKPYEHLDTPLGQEMLLLAKAKEQLILTEGGLDRRTFNTGKKLKKISSWMKGLQDFSNPQMNMLFNEIKSVAFGYKQRFVDFMSEKNVSVKKFMDAYEADKGTSIKSRLLNYSYEAYGNLYDKMEIRVKENGKVTDKKQEVNTLQFKDPEDMANGLKNYEREFIRESIAFHKKSLIRFVGKKIASGEFKGMPYKNAEEWYAKEYKAVERNMPVTRKKSGAFVAEGSVKGIATNYAQEATDFLDLSPGDLARDRKYRKFGSATAQIGGNIGNTGRLASLGLEMHDGEIVLSNMEKNENANPDVEQILHTSAFQNFKFEFEPKLISTYTAAKIILLKEAMATGASMDTEIGTMTDLFNNLLHNERMDINEGGSNIQKVMDATRTFTSTAVLMVNYKSAFLSTIGNLSALTTNALASRFGDHYFSGKDLFKAAKTAVTDMKKFGDLIDLFLFHDKNESALVFSSKYKEGERGYIKDHHKMILHHLGDRFTRGLVLVAQLHHENLIGNFEYDSDGKLFYNWAKDTRSKEITDYVRGKNEVQEKWDLPYDDMQVNTLTSIAAKIYGSYTDEDKNRIQTNGLAQFAFQFKGYLVARANEAVQSGFDNTNISWYKLDDKGKLTSSVYYQEGIFHSLLEFGKTVAQLKENPVFAFQNMKPEQRANMKKFGIDIAFLGMGYLAYALMSIDDDDEFRKELANSPEFMYLKFAWLDLVGIYNFWDYAESLSPASLSYLSKYWDVLIDFIQLDFEGSITKGLKTTGLGKTGFDIYRMVDHMSK